MSEKNSKFLPQIASQRDPQNLKNLTKSANWHSRTPFESSFGRFHCSKGFQVVPKDLQNLKNDSFTLIKPLFSEIHPSLKMVTFGPLLGAFWHHFPSHGLPNGAHSAKKDLSKNIKKQETQVAPRKLRKLVAVPKWILKIMKILLFLVSVEWAC